MAMTGRPARWWRTLPSGADAEIICELCPRACVLREGQVGFCGVRGAHDGQLLSLSYGHPTGLAVDPIEKKPLYHFLPGTSVLSFGTVGCSLGCRFCQNWSLSRGRPEQYAARIVEPQEIVQRARRERTPTIAFTYNEPTIFGEYVIEVAARAHAERLRTVMVTNGYVTPEARGEIFAEIDGANVDLKGFSEAFYHEQAAAQLAPVLETLRWIHHASDVWLEITTLLIPGLNDSAEMLTAECAWIHRELGPDVPVHFTAFHPDHKMTDRPRTPAETLQRAREIARDTGLHYVYTGNIADPGGQSTVCPGCGTQLIRRNWHASEVVGLAGATCGRCGGGIAGVFQLEEGSGPWRS